MQQELDPTSKSWYLAPAVWDAGEWLVQAPADGTLSVFAPPGVGLTENARDDEARYWRTATWHSHERFDAGLLPDSNTRRVGHLLDVAAVVPPKHHDWLIGQAEEYADALESAARLVATTPDRNSEEEIAELLDLAVDAYADVEQLRSSVLRPARGEADRVRAEIAALLRLMHLEVGAAANPAVLNLGLSRLESRLVQVMRHHAYVTESVSWRSTGWLRSLRLAAARHLGSRHEPPGSQSVA